MEEKIQFKTRSQQKTGLSSDWEKATGFTPLAGELIVYSDLNKIKIGDGESNVNDLDFIKADLTSGDGQSSTIIGSGTASGENSVVIGNGNATGTSAVVIGSGEASGTGATTIGSGIATGDYSIAEGADTIAGCKGYYISAIDPANRHIYLHTGEDAVIPTWDSPSNFYDATFDSRYQILNDSDNTLESYIPYANEFSIGSDSYYHWVFAGNIVEISGNRITYGENNSLNNTDKWINENNKYDGQVDPMTFFVPVQSDVGLTNVGTGAHAEGWETHAAAQHSHAEGYSSITAGRYGHAEGFGTRAGYAGHAEGKDTLAFGLDAHAEGSGTKAIGNDSHAEGINTEAIGKRAHAEGQLTYAIGDNSHAEGQDTYAEAARTHAEGYQTRAKGIYSHAEGGNTAAYDKAGHSEGLRTTSIGLASHAEGYSTNKASDVVSDLNINTKIADIQSVWENTKFSAAVGDGSHVEGNNTLANKCAHAEGDSTSASGISSHAEGGYETIEHENEDEKLSQTFYTEASGKFSHAGGAGTKATNIAAHSEGGAGVLAGYDGHFSNFEFRDTVASGEYSHAEGVGTAATNYGAHAEGLFGEANGMGSHVEGYYGSGSYESVYNVASGSGSHSEGAGTWARGFASHAEGGGTHDVGDGFSLSTAYSDYSHVEGYMTEAGEYLSSRGIGAHAEGMGIPLNMFAGELEYYGYDYNCTTAVGNGSHAEGLCTIAYGDYQHTQGRFNKIDYEGKYAHIVGNGAFDENEDMIIPSNAHTIDWDGNAWFAGNIKIGGTGQNDDNAKELVTKEYIDNIVDGVAGRRNSSTKGEIFNDLTNNVASGNYSHAEGRKTTAVNEGAHIEGTSGIKSPYNAFDDATKNEVLADWSSRVENLAERYSQAFGVASHVEGTNCLALGSRAHAEGQMTVAYGNDSHAEGKCTKAEGNFSHAEGLRTTASGAQSHAEGSSTIANGENAHAEGTGTKASSKNQHVQGKYNIEDILRDNNGNPILDDKGNKQPANIYAHIVGNGTSAKNSNAHTLDWEGNAWFAGNVTIGEDKKELATKEYVDSKSGGSNGTITVPIPGTSTAALRMLVADSQGNMSWVEIQRAEDVNV